MKKILITGGNGQVAYELIQLLVSKSYEVLSPARDQLDITQLAAVTEVIERFKPDAVINAAAYTRVDLAEQESQLSYAVNHEGAKNLAIACEKARCLLLHISTDYVFDGHQATPYLESNVIIPLNVYGTSKRHGEIAVQEYCPQAMTLRVSGVFGVHGNNFVKTILRLAKEKETLKIVSDQTFCPTPASAIAACILQMLLKPHHGIYHYCGDKPTNWHDFTKLIVKMALEKNCYMLVKDILAVTTAEYQAAAKRPAYSVLDCQKIKKTFGILQPDWEQGLHDVIKQLSL